MVLHRFALLALLALLATCERRETTPAPPAEPVPTARMPPPADAAPVDATPVVDARGPLVNLLRAAPSTITVSTAAPRRTVKPAHLVDGDPATSWSARERDYNAWITIDFASPSVVIHELRLTFGPAGISTQIGATHGSSSLGLFVLGGGVGPHVIALPPSSGDRTFEIELERGTTIAELEVWGTASPAIPSVPHVVVDTSELAQPLCTALVPKPDPEYPECSVDAALEPLPAPWGAPALLSHVTSRQVYHGHLYDETVETSLVLASLGKAWVGPKIETSRFEDDGSGNRTERSEVSIVEAKADQVIPGGPPEVIIRYAIAEDGESKELVVVCTADRRCTAPADAIGAMPLVFERR